MTNHDGTRVQHVPAGHAFARSVSPDTITPLPDPPVPGAPAGQWWPHPALELPWVTGTDADIVHVHFGFEHRTPAEMDAWIEALRRRGMGLVVTVHDLVNPHLGPDAAYDALLDALVPAADAVLTLTPGAAEEIAQRWGRSATTHPHPLVVTPDWLERPRVEHEGFVVGVHAKSLRPSFDLDALAVAATTVAELPGASLRLHVHEDVLQPEHPRHDPRLGEILAMPGVDARVHGPLSDEELWSDLLQTDLALLPYRFGTHSGWLEMAHDLGTDVLASAIGHVAQQRPIRTYADLDDLPRALREAHAAHRRGERPARLTREDRRREQDAVRDLHHETYQNVRQEVTR